MHAFVCVQFWYWIHPHEMHGTQYSPLVSVRYVIAAFPFQSVEFELFLSLGPVKGLSAERDWEVTGDSAAMFQSLSSKYMDFNCKYHDWTNNKTSNCYLSRCMLCSRLILLQIIFVQPLDRSIDWSITGNYGMTPTRNDLGTDSYFHADLFRRCIRKVVNFAQTVAGSCRGVRKTAKHIRFHRPSICSENRSNTLWSGNDAFSSSGRIFGVENRCSNCWMHLSGYDNGRLSVYRSKIE